MFFATLWAFLIGKNAIENGVKDAKLNSWSKQNTYDPTTNTYIDAKGFTKDATSGAVRNIYRTKDGRLIGKGIFGNDIVDYTMEQRARELEAARKNHNAFQTVIATYRGRYQDIYDPSKVYAIRKIYPNNAKEIPVYVDVNTAKVVRPIDEYMEFISHDEYYNHLKVITSDFCIRDMCVINEIIKQKNATITTNDFMKIWGKDSEFICLDIYIKDNLVTIKKAIEMSLHKDDERKVKRALQFRQSASGKAWLI